MVSLARLDRLRVMRGLSARVRSRHDRRAGCLCDFAVPGDAAPACDTSPSLLLFPVYMVWKLLDLARRPAPSSGFGRRASRSPIEFASMTYRPEGNRYEFRQRIC